MNLEHVSAGPPSRLHARRFTTDDLSERDRVAAWREFFGRSVLRTDIEPIPDLAFHADMTLRALPGLRTISGVISGARSARTRELIADGNNDLGLFVNLTGTRIVCGQGREVTLGAGDAVVQSCAEVATFTHSSRARFVGFRLPHPALAPLISAPQHGIVQGASPHESQEIAH